MYDRALERHKKRLDEISSRKATAKKHVEAEVSVRLNENKK